jgi:hypothetical protein
MILNLLMSYYRFYIFCNRIIITGFRVFSVVGTLDIRLLTNKCL